MPDVILHVYLVQIIAGLYAVFDGILMGTCTQYLKFLELGGIYKIICKLLISNVVVIYVSV